MNRAEAKERLLNGATISAYIISKNEEKNIGRAIKSVLWMDEIIVLDSGSTDNTVEIAQNLGAQVSTAEFRNFVEQRNRAMDLCTSDWMFCLSADEEVTPELKLSIEKVINRESSLKEPIIYKVARKNRYMGRWIKHCGWYPQYGARLSVKGQARWTGEMIHEKLEAKGPVGVLSGDLLHRPYSDLGEHLRTMDSYTFIWAQQEADSGRKTGLISIIFRPIGKFFKIYLLKAGFLDLGPGLILSLMGSWYTFMKYARLYELSRNLK